MKSTIVPGFCYTRSQILPHPSEITIRTETTGNFSTVSFAQDDKCIMLQVPVTEELKKILKEVIK